jgi:hypothetical protein
VAQACNPIYSGDRDQEDLSLKPARGNSSQDLISKKKKKITKMGLVEWLKVQDLFSNLSTAKKKKKKDVCMVKSQHRKRQHTEGSIPSEVLVTGCRDLIPSLQTRGTIAHGLRQYLSCDWLGSQHHLNNFVIV